MARRETAAARTRSRKACRAFGVSRTSASLFSDGTACPSSAGGAASSPTRLSWQAARRQPVWAEVGAAGLTRPVPRAVAGRLGCVARQVGACKVCSRLVPPSPFPVEGGDGRAARYAVALPFSAAVAHRRRYVSPCPCLSALDLCKLPADF